MDPRKLIGALEELGGVVVSVDTDNESHQFATMAGTATSMIAGRQTITVTTKFDTYHTGERVDAVYEMLKERDMRRRHPALETAYAEYQVLLKLYGA